MPDEPARATGEPRQLGENLGIQHLDGKQRDQTDHRAHAQRNPLAVGQVQHVVVELVGLIPQPAAVAADVLHRVRDIEEVLEELGGDVLIDVVVHRQFQRDPQEIERVHRHPCGAVGLADMAPGRQRLRAIEHADVVQTKETALEDVAAL